MATSATRIVGQIVGRENGASWDPEEATSRRAARLNGGTRNAPRSSVVSEGLHADHGHLAVIEGSAKFSNHLIRTCSRSWRSYVAKHYFALHCGGDQPPRQMPRRGGSPTLTSRVFDAVQDGATNAHEVVARTGLTVYQASLWLANLAKRQLIARGTSRGTYRRRP